MLKILRIFTKNIVLLIFAVTIFSCRNNDYNKIDSATFKHKTATFYGTESCKACHEQEYDLWSKSHHDLAMQIADSITVLGNFKNIKFESKGVQYYFFKKDGNFYVNTEGEGGIYSDFKIEYTFGVYPLQQYLIAFPDGKFQCLLAAWDSEKNKWFDLQPNLELHPDEWMHWTGGSMTWNNMCADCHSTNLQKNFDNNTNSYNTTFSIINVSCEACHGPSSTHVEYYENEEQYKGVQPPELYMGKVVPPQELVQKCARCHSRRSQLTNFFNYEGHFFDHYNPSLMTESIYELDGQIKDEVYVYGSFVQSKMYQNGISCKDCHDVHSLKLKKEGNNLCLTCHTPNYNEYEHHFHKVNTEASLCINCHMTGKYYMGNDFRRDHSFRIPRPDQTLTNGTPNACNGCHLDKTAKWASDFIAKNYGEKRAEHFSDDLLAGYNGETDAFYKVFSKINYPEIIRATALLQFSESQLSQEQIKLILNFIEDNSPLVRNQTILALDKLNSFDFSKYIEPMLLDSIRLVRISAARYFNMRNNSKIVNNPLYKRAQTDYLNELNVNSDFASGQHQIALFQQAIGNIDKSKKAYEKAIEIDNFYNPSRLNLALLVYNLGNKNYAEELYLKVIDQEPDYSYPYFMLGLLYNESGDNENSLKFLELATRKQPLMIRAFYNYAIKLQEKGLFEKSITVINRALIDNPLNEELLYIKLLGQINIKKNNDALNTISTLLQIAPENVNYQNILKELKNQ